MDRPTPAPACDRAEEPSFFVAGGTVASEAPSYVVRQADSELLAALRAGEFCYVLNARQMGKSSLMVRAARDLAAQGLKTVVIDLTAVGHSVDREQWYFGLLTEIGDQLDLAGPIDRCWAEHSKLGVVQRCFEVLRKAVLEEVDGNVVVFIDEIDVVRSLPFSTDEFFAAIRECYNRRAYEPEWSRLSFCLLGVATPSDLISDPHTTPFNVGRRIELHDFTLEETLALAPGLNSGRNGAALLRRVHHWTGGHPYLTQSFCQDLAGDPDVTDDRGVDRRCRGLFLGHRGQEHDDNLIFVRERLLRSRSDRAALLDAYLRILEGNRLRERIEEPLIEELRLTGAVRRVEDGLEVRNRIYGAVFDRAWVRRHMPDAEQRRQRAAFRRGLFRTASVSLVLLGTMGLLTLWALRLADRADAQAERADRQTESYRRLAYVADLARAGAALQEDPPNLDLIDEARRRAIPSPGQQDLRGFEWGFIGRATQLWAARWSVGGPITGLASAPGGKTVAVAEADRVRLFDSTSGRLLGECGLEDSPVTQIRFSPDGSLLVGLEGLQTPGRKLWGWSLRSKTPEWRVQVQGADLVGFDPEGNVTVTDGRSERHLDPESAKTVRQRPLDPESEYTWLRADGAAAIEWTRDELRIRSPWQQLIRIDERENMKIAWCPDGKRVALGGESGRLRVIDLVSGRTVLDKQVHRHQIHALAFGPDGDLIATVSKDLLVRVHSLDGTGVQLTGHRSSVLSLSWLDSKQLASGDVDGVVCIWDLGDPRVGISLKPQFKATGWAVTDGTLACWDDRGRTETWKIHGPGPIPPSLRTNVRGVHAAASSVGGAVIAVSHEGTVFAVGGDEGSVEVYHILSGRGQVLRAHFTRVSAMRFSSDDTRLATISERGDLRLWDLRTGLDLLQLRTNLENSFYVGFAQQDQILVMGAEDGAVVWDGRAR